MTTTPGIDVSEYQGKIDWAQVAAAGYRFAIIRATVGVSMIDRRFVENWDGARQAGLLTSVYHVVKPELSAEAQVNHFFDVLGVRRLDLPPVLDVELTGNLPSDKISSNVRECLWRINARGVRPIIYTAQWFWNPNVIASPEWARYDLWVANYGAASPRLPRDWQTWRFWQHSSSGRVPGIAGNVDLNWFAGDYAALLKYANRTPPPDVPASDPAVLYTVNILRNAYLCQKPREKEMGIVFGPSTYGAAVVSVYAESSGFVAISPKLDLWIPDWAVGRFAAVLYQAEATANLTVRDEGGSTTGDIIKSGVVVSVYEERDTGDYKDRAVFTPPGGPVRTVWQKYLRRL